MDKRLAHMILHKIVDCGPEVLLSDISGQEWAKRVLIKMVILPQSSHSCSEV